MKLGVLSRNYPPVQGGMSRHAYGLVQEIAKHDDVELFVPAYQGPPHERANLHPSLSRNVADNTELIRNTEVDAWLGLSAIYAPLAATTDTPFILYFHGNDFLHPVINPDRHLEARLSRLPGLWRLRKVLIQPLTKHIVKRRQAEINAALKSVKLVLFNSTYTRELAKQLYDFGNVPLEVLYPGCDEQFFQPRDTCGDGRLRLLTVSALASSNRRKNIDGVLEALKLLPGELAVTYTVVGSGNDLERLQYKAEDLGLANNVRFLGKVDDQTLLREYAANDLLVLAPRASSRDVEGFGMVYIEANAAGMPVLGSDQGGAVDAIVNGETGFIITESTPAHIADAIRQFAQAPRMFSETTIREHAARFRWPHIAESFRSLLRQHLG